MRRLIRDLPPETLLFTAAAVIAGSLVAAAVELPILPLLIVLLIGVSLLGLPHGALDPLIAHRANLWTGPLGFLAFNAAYIAIAALVVAMWLLVPPIALAGFLLVSAWHFAGDWFGRGAAIGRLAVGLALLCLPTVLHGPVVAEIYAVLAGPAGAQLVAAQQLVAGPAVIASAALFLSARPNDRRPGVELVAVFLVALFLPPLVFFLVYFCGLHSPRHLLAHARTLSSSVRPNRLALYVLGYTAGALAIFGGGFLALNAADIALNESLLRLVFIGLAALTVPHMLVLEYVERRAHE